MMEVSPMTIKELIKDAGMTYKLFSEMFGIPLRTVESWVLGGDHTRKCPDYVVNLIYYVMKNERMLGHSYFSWALSAEDCDKQK